MGGLDPPFHNTRFAPAERLDRRVKPADEKED